MIARGLEPRNTFIFDTFIWLYERIIGRSTPKAELINCLKLTGTNRAGAMFRYEYIDLFGQPFSEVSRVAISDQFETRSRILIRIDVRRAGIYGWYRLKLKTSDVTINRLRIRGSTYSVATETACDALVRAKHVGGYLFISRDIKSLELEVDLSKPTESRFSAELRAITLVEQIWLALRSPVRRNLRKLFRLKWPDVPIHFDFKFGDIRGVSIESSYRKWIRRREKKALTIVRERLAIVRFEPPSISILLPVCDPQPKYLREAIQSVEHQTRGDWQLCIADDASKNPEVIELIRQAMRDKRVRAVFRDQRGNISTATNSAFALAQHPFVFCLDHDDLIAPEAVELLSTFVAHCSDTEFLYSDEDKIDGGGNRLWPVFKPDYSPDLLLSYNYINHISMYPAESVRTAGGWHSTFDGAQDYDLALRILERVPPRKVKHLPAVLYRWRAIEGSTALDLGAKPWSSEAGRAAVQDHLRRIGLEAVTKIEQPNHYRVVYALPNPAPSVSIIIPVRDKHNLLRACIQSILNKTDYDNYDILIVDNGSVEDETLALLSELRRHPRITILADPGPFNYSALNNRAVAETDDDFVCFLNNDTRVISPDWLSELISRACQNWAGCVGPRLLCEDGTVQHAGIILGLSGSAGHVFGRQPRQTSGAYDRLQVACNYSALTAACFCDSS
jgi:glycosyltransferase involved in cell wall biosynthesis